MTSSPMQGIISCTRDTDEPGQIKLNDMRRHRAPRLRNTHDSP